MGISTGLELYRDLSVGGIGKGFATGYIFQGELFAGATSYRGMEEHFAGILFHAEENSRHDFKTV